MINKLMTDEEKLNWACKLVKETFDLKGYEFDKYEIERMLDSLGCRSFKRFVQKTEEIYQSDKRNRKIPYSLLFTMDGKIWKEVIQG